MLIFKKFNSLFFIVFLIFSLFQLASRNTQAATRVMLLADQGHLPMDEKSHLGFWLQKKASSQVELVIPEPQFISTRQMALQAKSLLKKHKPQLTLLLLNSDQQILRDYFSVEEKNQFCPVVRSVFSFREGQLQRMLSPTLEAVLEIQKEVHQSQSRFLVLWTGSSLRSETLNRVLGDCRWVAKLSGDQDFSFEPVIFEFNQTGVNLLRSLSFSSAYWRAQEKSQDPRERMQIYFKFLAEEMWPWILMDLD